MLRLSEGPEGLCPAEEPAAGENAAGGAAAQAEAQSAVIELSGIISEELIKDENAPDGLTPMLNGVDLRIGSGEIWGIGSSDKRCAALLCCIIGNIRPYYQGRCRVGRIGSVEKKRVLLPHIFNIASPDMLIDDMTVVEQLMLATMRRFRMESADRQEKVLDLLESCGLQHLALNRIDELYPQERLLLELLIASISSSGIITLDITPWEFGMRDTESLRLIAERSARKEKTVVIASDEPRLIGMACDHTAFIHKGRVVFEGTVEELTSGADRVCFVLRAEDGELARVMAEKIESLRPGWECRPEKESIYIFNNTGREITQAEFFGFLAENDIRPDNVKLNHGRVENAFRELVMRK